AFPEWQRIDIQQARLPDGRDGQTMLSQLRDFFLFVGRIDGFANDPVSAERFRIPRQEDHGIARAFRQGLALRFEPLAKLEQALRQKHPTMMTLPFKTPGKELIARRMTIDEVNRIAVGDRPQQRWVVVQPEVIAEPVEGHIHESGSHHLAFRHFGNPDQPFMDEASPDFARGGRKNWSIRSLTLSGTSD
ncbi:MAG: hypothetical protein RLZZ09_548, partial [Pseudomonadota bacterium]